MIEWIDCITTAIQWHTALIAMLIVWNVGMTLTWLSARGKRMSKEEAQTKNEEA